MHSSLFLLLLLPVFAAAAAVSPAITLENQFRAIHDAHHASKVQTLDSNVVMTRDELVSGKCAPIIIIFARGTTEPGISLASSSSSIIKGL
jgi:hypothetical protein